MHTQWRDAYWCNSIFLRAFWKCYPDPSRAWRQDRRPKQNKSSSLRYAAERLVDAKMRCNVVWTLSWNVPNCFPPIQPDLLIHESAGVFLARIWYWNFGISKRGNLREIIFPMTKFCLTLTGSASSLIFMRHGVFQAQEFSKIMLRKHWTKLGHADVTSELLILVLNWTKKIILVVFQRSLITQRFANEHISVNAYYPTGPKSTLKIFHTFQGQISMSSIEFDIFRTFHNLLRCGRSNLKSLFNMFTVANSIRSFPSSDRVTSGYHQT